MHSDRLDPIQHNSSAAVPAVTEASTTNVLSDFPVLGSLSNAQSSRYQISYPQQQMKNATDALLDAMKASTSREYSEFMEFLLGDPKSDAQRQCEIEEKAEEARMVLLHQLMKLDVEYQFASSAKKLLLMIQQSLGIATEANVLYGRFSYAMEDLLKDIYFQIETIHRDSNASFTSLNTSREEVTTTLLALIDDDYSRGILHEEIYQSIMNGDIRAPDYLLIQYNDYKRACEKLSLFSQTIRARYANIVESNAETEQDFIKRLLRSNQQEQVALGNRYAQYLEAPAILLGELRDACKSKPAYHHYIKELGRRRSQTGKTLCLSHKSASLFAKQKAFNLMIWRYARSCTELELAYAYDSDAHKEVIHLLQISEDHYARLLPVEQPQSTVSSLVLPPNYEEIRSIIIGHVKLVRKEHEALLKARCATYKPKNPIHLLKFNEELANAVSGFLDLFDQKWRNHLTNETKLSELLTELKTLAIADHMSQCCDQLGQAREELLAPINKTAGTITAQRVAQLNILLQTKHGVEQEAIPANYRTYTNEMLLALAGHVNLNYTDPITGDNLAIIALQHRCINIYHYLVVACQVDAKKKNLRDKSAEDYFRVMHQPEHQLVPIDANQTSFIESILLIKQMQLAIQRYQTALKNCHDTLAQGEVPDVVGLINMFLYRTLKWIDQNPTRGLSDHIALRLTEANQLLAVIEQALHESPTDFIAQLETVLYQTAPSSPFTTAIMFAFDVNSKAIYNRLRADLRLIKHDPKYRHLRNPAPQMKHEYDSKLRLVSEKLTEHERTIAELKRQQEVSDNAHHKELEALLSQLQAERKQKEEYNQRILRLETSLTQHTTTRVENRAAVSHTTNTVTTLNVSAATDPNRFQFASHHAITSPAAAAAANPNYN